MKGNEKKSQLIANSKNVGLHVTIGNENIQNSKTAKILGVTFDNELTFETHIKSLLKTAGQKISALARISPFMSFHKRKKLMNAFFKSQFSNCPLIWMFHNRTLEKKINNLHERCLRLVYLDTNSTLEELLVLDNSETFHHKNLKNLAIELFKTKNGTAPTFYDQIFQKKELKIITRSNSLFKSRKIKSTLHGKESLAYLGPKIWDLLPSELKDKQDVNCFKRQIRKWRPSACPCRLCSQYLHGVGFI